MPPKIPVKKAIKGRNIAKGQPNKLQLIFILSTLVWGVEIRNEITAPSKAPFFLNDIPVGITSQQQKGSGTPNNAP